MVIPYIISIAAASWFIARFIIAIISIIRGMNPRHIYYEFLPVLPFLFKLFLKHNKRILYDNSTYELRCMRRDQYGCFYLEYRSYTDVITTPPALTVIDCIRNSVIYIDTLQTEQIKHINEALMPQIITLPSNKESAYEDNAMKHFNIAILRSMA